MQSSPSFHCGPKDLVLSWEPCNEVVKEQGVGVDTIDYALDNFLLQGCPPWNYADRVLFEFDVVTPNLCNFDRFSFRESAFCSCNRSGGN